MRITTKSFWAAAALVATTALTGCASVPMTSAELDAQAKEFKAPEGDKAGLYVYRNSTFGGALTKLVSIDGSPLGNSAPMTYFYKEITAGKHILSTQSEFGDNSIEFVAEKGKLHFFRNYIKMGVFVGGANLEQVEEEKGKAGVLESKRAKLLGE